MLLGFYVSFCYSFMITYLIIIESKLNLSKVVLLIGAPIFLPVIVLNKILGTDFQSYFDK